MDKREELKRIIDKLPEERLPDPIEFLKWTIPVDDEELTEEDIAAIEKGKQQIENGEYITLDELLKETGDE